MTFSLRTLGRTFAAVSLLMASTLPAQHTPEVDDPANLTGEHVAPQALADTLPINHGAAALQQILLKLRTRASMMLIVAHPDDEDGGFLTYESRGQGARVAMLTLTRGEGGQNLMSADFDEALGLIRTQELLAADRYMGVDQFFGTEIDFGFSKTKEETLQKWTHERVLYDAVRCVRLYRPLVIASVFVGGPTDGHGHHQVSGEIAQEVFKAAADPNVFPEMIKEGLLPWAPSKVYARVPFSRVTADGMYDYATGQTVAPRFENYVTGQVSSTPPTPTVLIHEGDPATVSFNGQPAKPALGMDGLTYVQFARRGLALQKTQIGPNVRLAPPGRSDTGYTLMGSRVGKDGTTGAALSAGLSAPEQSIYEGIEVSLPGIASLAKTSPIDLRASLEAIDKDIADAQRLFDPNHLDADALPLRAALRKLDSLTNVMDEAQFGERYAKANILHELRVKRVQLNDALVLALQIDASGFVLADANSPSPLVPGGKYTVRSTLVVGSETGLKLESHFLRLTEGQSYTSTGAAYAKGAPRNDTAPEMWPTEVSANAPPTQPYFRRPSPEQPFYDVDNPALRNAPQTPAPLNLFYALDDHGTRLSIVRTVAAAQATIGTLAAPAIIVPALSVALAPTAGIITPAAKPLVMTATVTSQSEIPEATVGVAGPSGWEGALNTQLESTKRGQRDTFSLAITPRNYFAGQMYQLTATASDATHNYREGFRSVGYPGLTYTNLYTPATYRATAVDVTTAPGLRVAYFPGTGDPVSDFMPNLGVTPTIISSTDLIPETLAKFDTVVLGVRAYAAHPELAGKGSAPLNDFAAAGGVVIVQYNSASDATGTAPYPFRLPGDPSHNVVEEDQPVQLLVPDAPLLSWPNKIISADFDHWVEERGHGFASTWAPEYTALLETHDPGQDPQRGGLLLAPVGKGAYIYCAFALYRQLPDGVPGAYRLLANLISYAKNPAR